MKNFNKKCDVDVDLERDSFLIEQMIFHERKQKTISFLYPELAKEFSPNNLITPDLVYKKTNNNYLWICQKCNCEYLVTLSNRINAKSGCPYCSNYKVNNSNCLAAKYPELIEEWDEDKNGDLTPYNVLPGSEKKVYWKCKKCKRNWQTYTYQRTGKIKSGCPYCSHNKVTKEISFKYCFPNLVKWWDYEKNDLLPEDVTVYSNKKIYWKCTRCVYSFKNSPNGFVKITENHCPNCRKIITLNHKLDNIQKYWSLKNNINLTYDLKIDKDYIWKCSKNHEWIDTISNMKKKKAKCPYCSPIIMNPKIPDNLLEEWDYEKNILDTINLTSGSGREVYWKCSKGHSYKMQICKRAIRNFGCPYCSGRRASKEYCLASVSPELIKCWDEEKNKELTPYNVTPGSAKKVWWKCLECSSSFQRSVVSMNKTATCPNCYKKKKYKSLDIEYPDLLKDWDYGKNEMLPSDYSAHSNQYVWWKCSNCNFSWETQIYTRSAKNSGCPNCYKNKRKKYTK